MGHSILMVASECAPFAKTGGLGDVIRGLSVTLQRLGHEVTVFLPYYRTIRDANIGVRKLSRRLRILMGEKRLEGNLLSFKDADGVTYIFLDNRDLFDRDGFYVDPATGTDYEDNDVRFGFFARSALAYGKTLKKAPHIFHGHDWQAGLSIAALHFDPDPFFSGTSTVITIHNLAYQGLFPQESLPVFGLPDESFQEEGIRFFEKISLLKAGVAYADAIAIVSPTYAQEIQGEEFGFGFQEILTKRADRLHGILNGVDYDEWSPEKDRYIAANFSAKDLSGKAVCKADLLATMGLTRELQDAPLFGVVSRLIEQKGIDFIIEILPDVLAHGGVLVMLGRGEGEIEEKLVTLAKDHSERVAVRIDYSEELAHKIKAGADFFLMPSRFEPCGLSQMYSLRYGTLPIVRAVGGLADTVKEFSLKTGHGNGFRFNDASPEALLKAVAKALDVYGSSEWLERARKNAMKENFSWIRQGRKYASLYRNLISAKKESGTE